jgi:hypothetical protein
LVGYENNGKKRHGRKKTRGIMRGGMACSWNKKKKV